jgi:hypothetical protein
MRKPIVSIVMAAILLLTLGVTASTATPPVDVTIVAHTSFGPTGSFGPFVASGPAVDAGLICPSGDTFDLVSKVTGYQSNRGANYFVRKLFICADESGTFIVQLEVRLDYRGDNANWNVLSGTGAYEKLHGTGKLVGLDPDSPGYAVKDVYTGQMH